MTARGVQSLPAEVPVSSTTLTNSWPIDLPGRMQCMVSRLRFVLGQLGAKPGASQSLARLLDAPDLDAVAPAGVRRQWRRLDQRTWRTGAVATPQPWQAAARTIGSVTAWRSFEAGPGRQWLWLQWSPLASPADAAAALAAAQDPAQVMPNPAATVVTTERRSIEPPPVVAGADRVTATHERTGADPVLTLRCLAGRHLLVLCGSGAGWDWPALVSVAERQLRQLST